MYQQGIEKINAIINFKKKVQKIGKRKKSCRKFQDTRAY